MSDVDGGATGVAPGEEGKKPFWKRWWFIALAVVVVLAALAGGGDDNDPPPTAANERFVTADDYGDDWPLTVEGGVLRCVGAGAVLFIPPGGPMYAVNGMASSVRDAVDIEPIWVAGEVAPKKDLGPLISDGLELCP